MTIPDDGFARSPSQLQQARLTLIAHLGALALFGGAAVNVYFGRSSAAGRALSAPSGP